MEDLDIIEERDGYRVRLELDDSAEKPEGEGEPPILTVETNRYGGYRVNAFNNQASGYVDMAAEILGRHGMDTLERFVKIFHGATQMELYWSTGIDGYYLAFDPEVWLKEIGVTADNPDIEPVDRVSGSLDEVRAWAEGDVYGWIVEREVRFRKQYLDEDGDEVTAVEHGTEWAETESCWGFYGRDYAEQAAKEALETELENN